MFDTFIYFAKTLSFAMLSIFILVYFCKIQHSDKNCKNRYENIIKDIILSDKENIETFQKILYEYMNLYETDIHRYTLEKDDALAELFSDINAFYMEQPMDECLSEFCITDRNVVVKTAINTLKIIGE